MRQLRKGRIKLKQVLKKLLKHSWFEKKKFLKEIHTFLLPNIADTLIPFNHQLLFLVTATLKPAMMMMMMGMNNDPPHMILATDP